MISFAFKSWLVFPIVFSNFILLAALCHAERGLSFAKRSSTAVEVEALARRLRRPEILSLLKDLIPATIARLQDNRDISGIVVRTR